MPSNVEYVRMKKEIRRDKKVRTLKNSFDNYRDYNVNVKEMYEEINLIHKIRKTRQLNRESRSFINELTDGLIDDQIQRSRLSEILMSCVHVINDLSYALGELEGYALVKYGSSLSSISTKGERQSFIKHDVLGIFYSYVDRVSRVKDAAEIVITDIDKAGFMYKNLIEAVKLATEKRSSV